MSEKPARESPEASQRPFLAVFDDKLRSIPLGEGTLLIGRSRRNHLRIHDHLLSRKHCSLTLASDKLTLVDLNSSNGTYVNGDRVGTRDLEIDDIIELGKTVMVVFDGSSWRRGDGLMNLRNPLKAQELVLRLQEEV
ncbi:MAG: FHA domain-containing protein, partial [Planctomycetota bacterium]